MRKYRKGEPIKTIDECLDKEFIMFEDKVYHKGWFRGWQVQCLDSWIRQGILYNVELIREKTILEEFKEKYPLAPLCSDGSPTVCPFAVGYPNGNCDGRDCLECWSRPAKTT